MGVVYVFVLQPVPPHRRQEVVREAYVPPQQDVGGRRMSNSYEQEYQKQPQYYEVSAADVLNFCQTGEKSSMTACFL